jgi:hypothetical protein
MLATGFVADTPGQGSIFPSAGGSSASPQVQAVYWRCIVVLFASARYWNPDLRLALFSNVAPPSVDGHDLAAILARLGVECRLVPLEVRLSSERTPTWGNVLYFYNLLDSLGSEAGDLRFALVDSDIVVNGRLDPVFDLFDAYEFVGYQADTAPDEDVNDMTPREMADAVRELDPAFEPRVVPHFGGEFLGLKVASWARHRALFADLLGRSLARTGVAGKARTEEHLWSIAFAALGLDRIGSVNRYLKRIWTHPRVNNVARGDEKLPIWHLPYEKRYGFAYLFADLAARGFPARMDPLEFRVLAQRRCGIPRKTAGKLVRDGVRQVAGKIGLRR